VEGTVKPKIRAVPGSCDRVDAVVGGECLLLENLVCAAVRPYVTSISYGLVYRTVARSVAIDAVMME